MFLTLLAAFAAPVFGANHYIRSGATGSQSGADWANACSGFTGSCAVSSLVRGDTYDVADGSYGSYTLTRGANGTSVITIKKATVQDHGTDTGWVDTFGDGQATFGPLAFTTSYWMFDGQTGGGPGSWTSGFGFAVKPTGTTPGIKFTSTNVTVRHLKLPATETHPVAAVLPKMA